MENPCGECLIKVNCRNMCPDATPYFKNMVKTDKKYVVNDWFDDEESYEDYLRRGIKHLVKHRKNFKYSLWRSICYFITGCIISGFIILII